MVTKSKPLPAFPENLLVFQRMFPDEAACLRYLEQVRWPQGFACEACGAGTEPYRLAERPRVLRCRDCLHETTVTAGTVMHRTKTSLLVWFWAAHLVSTSTPGISALELQKRLGIARYETAFQLLHKLRAGMVRPGRDRIGVEWPVEMDVIYVGGKHKGGRQGLTKQTPVGIAVEVRRSDVVQDPNNPDGKEQKDRIYAGRVRLAVLPNKTASTLTAFAEASIEPGALVISDAGGEFANVKGYVHERVAMHGQRDKADAWLPMVGIVTANLKAWIDGTHHGVLRKHLQGYLNEFTFRFNRRFNRAVSFRTLLGLGAEHAGPTYQDIYAGTWHHAGRIKDTP